MCLAFPAQVIELLPAEQAVVDLDGVRKTVSVLLLEDVAIGEYVMVHVGFALAKVDAEEAAQTLALMKEAMALTGPLADREEVPA
ncbi:MAG: HypC/HybG/HupF family hydrogenase formation chaperone [Alphaproteobacteria bacterium]|jgi:hydrogenase expression/formation protein HypC|nr:HypC/HybG/HupF family hydrogenase formation chaperone [Alphaproteobacteria bacterium]